jgi:hypothetical protein
MANRRLFRTGLLGVFTLLFVLGTAAPGAATGNIVKSDLKGTWNISLHGLTGCGFVSMLATMTFNTNGTGTGPIQIHGACGDSMLAGQTFTVNTLTAKGTGKATLTCGGGCLWHFNIQVAPDRTKFNLVDVTATDTDAFLAGVAVVSSVADNIVTADLKGDWHVSLMGRQLRPECVPQDVQVSAAAMMTLDVAGAGNINVTLRTTCGNGDVVNTFAISALNPDGSGTAHLDCGGACGFDFSIQVSPDRSMFNLVTVSPTDTGDMLAGVATRRSMGGQITKTNLAGPWQGHFLGQDIVGGSTGVSAFVLTFRLNAKALTNTATLVIHGEEGDLTFTDLTFEVQTLNADGSGTARLTDGSDVFNFRIQVSPDRSTIGLAGVDPASEDMFAGFFVHQ